MNKFNVFDELSNTAKQKLGARITSSPVIDDRLRSRISGFNRERESPVATEGTEDINDLKRDILGALTQLEALVDALLVERKNDERNVKRWIFLVGILLILMVIAALLMPFLHLTAKAWPTTVLSGVSLAGLVYLLYSPVPRIMAIANDRANLRLIPTLFRVQVISAGDGQELRKIASELTNSLRRVGQSEEPAMRI